MSTYLKPKGMQQVDQEEVKESRISSFSVVGSRSSSSEIYSAFKYVGNRPSYTSNLIVFKKRSSLVNILSRCME